MSDLKLFIEIFKAQIVIYLITLFKTNCCLYIFIAKNMSFIVHREVSAFFQELKVTILSLMLTVRPLILGTQKSFLIMHYHLKCQPYVNVANFLVKSNH